MSNSGHIIKYIPVRQMSYKLHGNIDQRLLMNGIEKSIFIIENNVAVRALPEEATLELFIYKIRYIEFGVYEVGNEKHRENSM